MSRKSAIAKPRPVGRPKSRPPGAVLWNVWVTAEERESLKAHLAKLRDKKQ